VEIFKSWGIVTWKSYQGMLFDVSFTFATTPMFGSTVVAQYFRLCIFSALLCIVTL